MIQDDRQLASYGNEIVPLATCFALPLFSLYSSVDGGGRMCYGPSLPAICRRSAMYEDSILKGAKPSDLPIEQPTNFELVINLHTAGRWAPSLMAAAQVGRRDCGGNLHDAWTKSDAERSNGTAPQT